MKGSVLGINDLVVHYVEASYKVIGFGMTNFGRLGGISSCWGKKKP